MATDKAILRKLRELRKKGFSIPEISRELVLPRSTVYRHACLVQILPKNRKRWLDRRNASKMLFERNWRVAMDNANRRVPSLTERELVLIVAILYWAEGAKKDLSFSNTDPRMIRIFVDLLKKVFGVQKKDIVISLRVYEDLEVGLCLSFWSKVTKFKLGSSTSVNMVKGSKKGKLKYGMCRVRVRKGGLLLKELSAIINRVTELI